MRDKPENVRLTWLVGLALGFVTLGFFLPTLRHGFLAYDDQQYVTENFAVRAGLNLHTVAWAFGRHASNWHPLTWLSHALDCQVFGLNPAGHHLANVLLHSANTLLLFLLLNRMTRTTRRSAFVAVLFAWHPLHVESVAWIAERKDVLSAFFFFLTLLAYHGYVGVRDVPTLPEEQKGKGDNGGAQLNVASKTLRAEDVSRLGRQTAWRSHAATLYYALTIGCFACALMSKPMVVTLPFVLLVLDFWPLQRFGKRGLAKLLWEKTPFFAMSAVTCWLTIWAQQQAIASTVGLPLEQRIIHAIAAYGHYLGAIFVPMNLAVYYPYVRSLPARIFILDGAALVVISGLAIAAVKRRPYMLVGWLIFIGMLVPVIGLVQVGDQAWADRYSYLPSIGLFLAVIWGIADLFERLRERMPTRTKLLQGLTAAAALAIAVALLTMTTVQLSYWRSSWTLFEHAATVTKRNPMAATMLGSLLAKDGKLEQAIAYYREALSYEPRFPEAHFFLGNALEKQGKLDDALSEYNQALWFKPSQVETHIFIAGILAKQNKTRDAESHYTAALRLNPVSAVAQNNLAKLLHAEGRLTDARSHYVEALKIDSAFAQAHNNFGVLLLQTGKIAEGVNELRQANRLNPNDTETLYNLARGLNQQQQWQDAADILAKLLPARQNDPRLHAELGLALSHLTRTREAMGQFAQALLLNPDFPEALTGLAWILSTDAHSEIRNGDEALKMAARACELTGNKLPELILTLAAAYAEKGQFEEARQKAKAAGAIATRDGDSERAAKCQRLAERFSSGQPWRE